VRKRSLAAALMFLLLSQGARAAPIVGLAADPLPRGTFTLDTWFVWQDYQRAWDENLYGDGVGGWIDLPAGSRITAGSFVPRLCYGATDWLTLQAAVPLEDRFTELMEPEGQETSTGLGDVVIDSRMQVVRGLSGYPRVALLAGVRFPTGNAEGTLPLSDGSTDLLVGGAVTHAAGLLMAHASVVYWVNGEGEGGLDTKNVWVGTATLESPVDDHWSLLWEFTSTFGEEPSDHYRLYACPGVSWSGERLTIGMSSLFSAGARGGGGVGWADFTWAPYVRVVYRFF
jgi:hypothetical protein